MTKCSECGIEVMTGQYVLIDDEAVCLNCTSKIKKKGKISKPRIITCPYCHNTYDIRNRKCTKCEEYNPVYDFHFIEFFVNVGIGFIIILIPIYIILALFKVPFSSGGTITSSLVIIELFLAVFILAILFYLGRWIRDWFNSRRNKK